MNQVVGGSYRDNFDHDGMLLVQARADIAAFGEFYDRNYPNVLTFFYRRTFCAHTSADLTAEAFAEALVGLERFKPERGSATGWLFGIASNLHRQWLRRGAVAQRARNRLKIITPELVDDDLIHIEELADSTELRARLQAALHTLSDGTRQAVVLRLGHDLPYEAVAEACGCSASAARVRVSRGLHTLANLLGEAP